MTVRECIVRRGSHCEGRQRRGNLIVPSSFLRQITRELSLFDVHSRTKVSALGLIVIVVHATIPGLVAGLVNSELAYTVPVRNTNESS